MFGFYYLFNNYKIHSNISISNILISQYPLYLCKMLTISHRGQQMPPSPIRKLVPYAEAAKKRGTKVYHLNIGQPDIETPAQILDAVRHSDFKVLEYSHSAGNESYRKKLVEYYKRVGINVTAEQIIITTGGSEAIIIWLYGLYGCGR